MKRTRESETEDDAEWLRQSNLQQDSEGLAASEVSSDEDDDKVQKPKLGAGLWGRGPPLVSHMLGKRMEFTDGFGLCSPGRWPPSKRRCAADTSSLGFAKSLGKELRKLLAQKLDARALAFKLATGTWHNCPFSDELIQDGRELLLTALEMAGCKLPVRETPEDQPFFLAAIEELLRISGDPDCRAFYSSKYSFAKGVKVGYKLKLPRIPAVFNRKNRWRKYALGDFELGDCRENYLSARQHAEHVHQQFLEEEKLGAMIEVPLEEAQREYGQQLAVASLGAIEKKGGAYRVVHDGTHGIGVNPAIRVRDQIQSPTAGDVAAVMQELPGVFFGLTGDVARAHRLVKIAREDWGLLACRTGIGNSDALWLNKVGAFGIASAAYHWSRLLGGVGRAVYYLLGQAEIFLLAYVDDLLWLTRDCKGLELIVLSIYFLQILGLPFAWHKFHGRLQFEWVGFQICLDGCKLGISERRSQWLVGWLRQACNEGQVQVADMSAVLGRLSFALTALGHLRPFLGPIYAWVAAVTGKMRVARLPKALKLIFSFLCTALDGDGRLRALGRKVSEERELYRTDARAEGDEVWIGGWALDHDDTRRCRWFSERLDHTSAPWLFCSGESYRQIASLELLATLAAVVVFGLPVQAAGRVRCSASTDNKGNAQVVKRWMTTKFPLCAFLMELAIQLQRSGAELWLHWIPRLQNEEADALSNGVHAGFDPALRRRFDLQTFQGVVLHQMLAEGANLYDEIKEAKKGKFIKKLPKSQPLKTKEPWG